MILRFVPLLLLLVWITVCPIHASLLNFYFTTNASGGTITGEIEGLQSTGSSSPSEVVIFSQPSGYTNGADALIANGFTFYGTDNNFTVSGGNIVGADVTLYKSITGSDYQGYGFNVNEDGYTGANGIYETNNGVTKSNLNTGGFAGTTYTSTYTPVPEPRAEAVLFLLAIAGLVACRKFRGPSFRSFRAA